MLLGDGLDVIPFEMEVGIKNSGGKKETFVLFVVLILDDIDIGRVGRSDDVSVIERDGRIGPYGIGVLGIGDGVGFSSFLGSELDV